jgi:hypothetical protein
MADGSFDAFHSHMHCDLLRAISASIVKVMQPATSTTATRPRLDVNNAVKVIEEVFYHAKFTAYLGCIDFG